MWLLGWLQPDFKTIANFRRTNGKAIQRVCVEFIRLCKKRGLFSQALIAIDGSKFKGCNNRDRNFTPAKMKRRVAEIELSMGRYFARLDRVDIDDPTADDQTQQLKEKMASLKQEVENLKALDKQ